MNTTLTLLLALAVSGSAAAQVTAPVNPAGLTPVDVLPVPSVPLQLHGASDVPSPLAPAEVTDFVSFPYYWLPDGVFFNGALTSVDPDNAVKWGYTLNSAPTVIYAPGDTPLVWNNLATYEGDLPGFDFSWRYYVPDADNPDADPVAKTAKSWNLTTPAYPLGTTMIGAPAVTFCGATYGDGYKLNVGGRPVYNVNIPDVGAVRCIYPLCDFDRTLSTASADELYHSHLSNWVSNYRNFSIGYHPFRYLDTRLHTCILEIPKPANDQILGVKSVIFDGWVTQPIKGQIKVDIYEKHVDTDRWGNKTVSLGDRLGGGWVEGSEITPSNYLQAVTVPLVEAENGFTRLSFVNIDRDVFVAVTTDDIDDQSLILRSVFMSTKSQLRSRAWYVLEVLADANADDPDADRDYSVPTGQTILQEGTALRFYFDPDDKDELMTIVSYSFYLDGVYSELSCTSHTPDRLSIAAGPQGGTYTFTLNPVFDLIEDGQFSGEGVDDWIAAYPDDPDSDTGLQNVIIEVEPLPVGVLSRTSVVTVAQPGSKLEIPVTQDASFTGIDTLDADNDTSAQCYDLQGRRLAAVPTAGLYITRQGMSVRKHAASSR